MSSSESGSDEPAGTAPTAGNASLARIFAVVTSALLIQSLDATIVATALDALQTEFDTSLGWASWTITAYATGMVIALPVSAKLCDVFDPKRIFLISVVAFALMSLLCGLSQTMGQLVILRGAQAIAGAGLTPAITSIIVRHFGPARDRALGLFASMFQIGSIAGPAIGGLFVEFLSWRWIFEINVPICLLLAAFGLKVIPRSATPRGSPRPKLHFDGRGIALLGAAVLFLMLGASMVAGDSRHAQVIGIAVMTASMIVCVSFVMHVRRAASPLISPRLLLGKRFRNVNLVNILYGGGLSGALSLLPVYAMQSFGMGALKAGSLLSVAAVSGALFAVAGTIRLRRSGYRRPIAFNAIVAGLAMVAIGLDRFPQDHQYVILSAVVAIVGMSTGLADPAARNAGLQLLPDSAPAIAAVRTMCRRLGTVVVVSALSLVGTQFAATSGLRFGFLGFGVLLLLASPAIRGVPEHRGAW